MTIPMTTSWRELSETPLPERVQVPTLGEPRDEQRARLLADRLARFADVPVPEPNVDGEVEELPGGAEVTHRFVEAPGESATVRWHLVDGGPADAEPILFLHGLPDSWFMWHHQMSALADRYRVVSVDLKGYGQSDKGTGDYRQEGVAAQLAALLDELGVGRCNLVAHDRGTVVADYLAGNEPERVLRYARGEQHLWHFNQACAPQEAIFTNPELASAVLGSPETPVRAYTNLTELDIADDDLRRTVAEWRHPGIGWAVPRYFASSSFRKEWIDRRTRLIGAWDFPVLVLQAHDDPLQPREFYVDVPDLLLDAEVTFLECGHFFPLEAPAATTAAIETLLAREAR